MSLISSGLLLHYFDAHPRRGLRHKNQVESWTTMYLTCSTKHILVSTMTYGGFSCVKPGLLFPLMAEIMH
jgi:hypothetical protein